jgi:hypothetical protein
MTVSDEMVERAAEQYWNDFHARMGGPWSNRDPQDVCVIQMKATARAMLTAALQDSPGDKPCFHDEVVFLREVDAGTDNACWVISNRVDPGAVAFFRGVFVPRHDGNTATDGGAK